MKFSISINPIFVAVSSAVSVALLGETNIWAFKPLVGVFGYILYTALLIATLIGFALITIFQQDMHKKNGTGLRAIITFLAVAVSSLVFHHYGNTYLEYVSGSCFVLGILIRIA